MKSTWMRLGLLALMISALAGCGAGKDGAAGAAGTSGTPGTPGAPGTGGNVVNVKNLTTAEWKSLKPSISNISVNMSSGKPVVTFMVTDANNNPLIGLEGQTLTSANAAAGLPHTNYNLAFTLAKLVPATASAPSKWVTYLVTTPRQSGTTAAAGGVVDVLNAGVTWVGNFPQSDNQGTLTSNNDGTYSYTFYRDITQSAAIVAGLSGTYNTAPYLKADLGDTTYDASLTHRLGIILSGSQPGTGTATPTGVLSVPAVPLVNTFNTGFDFVPATPGVAPTVTRDIVKKDSCTECHAGKGIGHWNNTISPGDTIGRNDPRLCVTCHTDQIRYTFNAGEASSVAGSNGYVLNGTTRPTTAIVDGRALGNYPNLIHHMHMGEELVKTGYFFNAASEGAFNDKKLPQSPSNCIKCHDGSATAVNKTADGDNWKNKPSRLACGACHDGINFATGAGVTLADRDADVLAGNPVGTTHTGHLPGPLTDDTNCSSCHASSTTGAIADIEVLHRATTATTHNPIAKAGVAAITYTLSSVSVVANQPVIKFKITKTEAGVTADVTSLAVPTLVTNATNGQQVINPTYEPIPGFAGGPSFYLAYAVPQDGIAAPADFNVYSSASLANLMVPVGTSPNQGTLVYDGPTALWTATLTGDLVGQPKGAGCVAPVAPATNTSCVSTAVAISPILVPAAAKMLTGAIIGTFTQKNLAAYPYTPADYSVNNVASAAGVTPVVPAGYARAKGGVIIKSLLQKKPVSATDARRVITDASKCNSCHDQLGTSPEFHGGARNDPTACNICHNGNRTSNGWTADSSTHIHGIHGGGPEGKRTVPFTWTAVAANDNYSMIEYPGVLKNCNQCHLPNTVNFSATGGDTVQPNLLWSTTATGKFDPASTTAFRNSPYVVVDNVTSYGSGFSYTVSASGVPSTTEATSATLVNSPIASACFACHDTTTAKNHMQTNGGAIYQTRLSQSDGSGKLVNREACLACHGAGKFMDAAVVHQ